MRKQPEVTEATRNTFIKVFCELYEIKPIEKITVREITEIAGYSRVTFYNYFKDPYDILEHIEKVFITYVMELASANILSGNPLDRFIKSLTKAVRARESFGLVLFKSPYNTRFINHFKDALLPMLMTSFNISANNLHAVYTLEFYIPGMISTFSRWVKNENEMTIEQLAELLKSIIEEGISVQMSK